MQNMSAYKVAHEKVKTLASAKPARVKICGGFRTPLGAVRLERVECSLKAARHVLADPHGTVERRLCAAGNAGNLPDNVQESRCLDGNGLLVSGGLFFGLEVQPGARCSAFIFHPVDVKRTDARTTPVDEQLERREVDVGSLFVSRHGYFSVCN